MSENTQKNVRKLTKKELEQIKEDLISQDILYAADIDERQNKFFQSKRLSVIRNWQEFETSEKMKRLMLGLHTTKEDTPPTTIVRINNPLKAELQKKKDPEKNE